MVTEDRWWVGVDVGKEFHWVAVFDDAGRHARTTIGVPSLPGDAAVEVEALLEVG